MFTLFKPKIARRSTLANRAVLLLLLGGVSSGAVTIAEEARSAPRPRDPWCAIEFTRGTAVEQRRQAEGADDALIHSLAEVPPSGPTLVRLIRRYIQENATLNLKKGVDGTAELVELHRDLVEAIELRFSTLMQLIFGRNSQYLAEIELTKLREAILKDKALTLRQETIQEFLFTTFPLYLTLRNLLTTMPPPLDHTYGSDENFRFWTDLYGHGDDKSNNPYLALFEGLEPVYVFIEVAYQKAGNLDLLKQRLGLIP